MFIVMGAFKDVRRGLLKRGWLEDETKSRPDVHLKWTLYDTDVGYNGLKEYQMVNHFEGNGQVCACRERAREGETKGEREREIKRERQTQRDRASEREKERERERERESKRQRERER